MGGWPKRAILLIAATALLAGCATREPRRDSAPRQRPPATVRPAPVLAPADYVRTASSIDLFVIQASELALTRAADPRLRNLARELIAAHRGTSAQLSLAGRRLNLLPSAQLLPVHADLLARLNASPSFDRTYREQLLLVHESAERIHASFASGGASPTLRPVARNAQPIERRHLAALRSIR